MKAIVSKFLVAGLLAGTAQCVSAASVPEGEPVQMDKMLVGVTKTHTLFMGADVSIALDKDLYPVRDVFGSSWVVTINGQPKVISAKEGALKIKVTPQLKLTEGYATIDNLMEENGYTFANDPSVRITRAMTQSELQTDDYHAALNQAQATQDQTIAGSQMKANIDASNSKSYNSRADSPGARLPVIQQTLSNADQIVRVATGQSGSDQEPGRNNPLSDGYDALDVSFDVSSARPLQRPYVVTMTRFHVEGTKAGTVQVLVYAKALDPVDSHPSRIHFLEQGLPRNFKVTDFQLHLYDKGTEVATSVSANRVDLTRAEAFEYIKMEYVGAHQGQTLPPIPAMGRLPADLTGHLATGKYSETYYVTVSKDGMADGPFADSACTSRVQDAYLESVVKGILFKPALAQGKPVQGTAPLDLNKLTI